MISSFNNWQFMLGEWQSDPETHVGNENGTINKAHITSRPSDLFIFMINEVYRSGNLQGEGWNLFFYDDRLDQIKCKSVYGMGFIVNYSEQVRSENRVTLIAESVDSMPDGFEGSQWQLILTKISTDEFMITLKMSSDSNFTTFWEAKYDRINS